MHRKPHAAWPAAIATATALSLVVLLGGAAMPAQAGPPDDAVLDWNLHAVNALINASTATPTGVGQTPPVSALHLAMVQGAVYDAVNMIDGGREPYLDDLPSAPPSASKAGAVATAAHEVLVGLRAGAGGALILPSAIVTRLDNEYASAITAATAQDGLTNVNAGVAAGAAAAAAMLAARADDGRYGPFRFTVPASPNPGDWLPTSGVNDPFGWVARVDPFTLESTSQFRTKGPHGMNTGIYAKEYDEVRLYGGDGTSPNSPLLRTPDQTALARFFTANPIEMFNRTFRTLASSELSLVEEARLFAMLNVAAADGLINCWDDKAHWSFWRPVTAIRAGGTDGNRKTDADPVWNSLVPSPPYPDHPSGYNCATSAFMHTAEAFFGKGKMAFSVTANNVAGLPPSVTRHYGRFTDVIDDTIDARVYLGIHFRAPDVQGAGIGKDVSHWLDKHYFGPVK